MFGAMDMMGPAIGVAGKVAKGVATGLMGLANGSAPPVAPASPGAPAPVAPTPGGIMQTAPSSQGLGYTPAARQRNQEAQQRRDAGTMTPQDASRLGLMPYGSITREKPYQIMVGEGDSARQMRVTREGYVDYLNQRQQGKLAQQQMDEKKVSQDAKTYDFLAKQGLIPSADPMGSSALEKSMAVLGLMDAAELGGKLQGLNNSQLQGAKLMGEAQGQQLQNQRFQNEMNAPPEEPWKPSPVDFDNDGTPDMLMTSPSSAVAAPRDGSPAQLMGPQGPVVQKNGFYATWDPKVGAYTGWKPMDRWGDLSSMSPEDRRLAILMGRGGQRDYSGVPEYVVENSMGDAPPMVGARKAPGGKWYLQKDSKWFRVEK